MSPGPLSSSSRSGLTFTHGGNRSFGFSHRQAPFCGTRQVSPPINRVYGAARQKFSVTPGADGGSVIALTEDETVTVGTGDDGAVSITIGTKPEPEDTAVEVEVEVARPDIAAPRGGALGLRRKMAVTAASDGSINISADLGQQLVVLGDEDSVLIVGELPAE
jgi:hypothetical protein